MRTKRNKQDRKELGRFTVKHYVSGALALMAGTCLFWVPVHAVVPDSQAFQSGGESSVTMKVKTRPITASADSMGMSAANAVDAQPGVSMKVSRPPSQSPPSSVSMKVSRPPAVSTPVQPAEEPESVSLKVAPRPPAAEPPELAQDTQELPAANEEMVAISPEQPIAAPSGSQAEPVAETAKPMPEIKIGAGDVGEEPEPQEEGVEVATINEDYRYIRGAKLNPFRPLTDKPDQTIPPVVEQKPAGGEVVVAQPSRRPKPRAVITPIERYPLNTLNLVAIMRMKKEALALVQIPDGNKGFIIRNGTYIGSEGGTVSEIDLQNNKVVVDVEEEDMFGNITINKRQLSLQKSAGDL